MGLEQERDRHENTMLELIPPLCTLNPVESGAKYIGLGNVGLYCSEIIPCVLDAHAIIHALAVISLRAVPGQAPAPLLALGAPAGPLQHCPRAPLSTDPPF